MRDILSYMNAQSKKVFNKYQVTVIDSSVRKEAKLRKEEGLELKPRTNEGRAIINKRTAAIANEVLGGNIIAPEDVVLWKKCRAQEYQDRTGRCAWGFKDIRKRLGYDENTGYELDI